MSQWWSNTSNVAKTHYRKIKSENIAVKAKSCLEKLQDSSKSSEQLAPVNKTTHSSNKINFEKDETNIQKLRKEKVAFSNSKDNFRVRLLVLVLLYKVFPIVSKWKSEMFSFSFFFFFFWRKGISKYGYGR